MKLIRFEDSIGGRDLYVNPDKIACIETDEDKSVITFDNGTRVHVKETSEVIGNMGIFS